MKKKNIILENLIILLHKYNFTVRVGNGDIIINIPFGAKRIATEELQTCIKGEIHADNLYSMRP